MPQQGHVGAAGIWVGHREGTARSPLSRCTYCASPTVTQFLSSKTWLSIKKRNK